MLFISKVILCDTVILATKRWSVENFCHSWLGGPRLMDMDVPCDTATTHKA